MPELDIPDLNYVNISNETEWKQWYRSVINGTYVVTHDLYIWHVDRKKRNNCILHERIKNRFIGWKNLQCLIRHDANKRLWVTFKFPDHYCVGGCGKPLRPHKSECISCLNKRIKAARPFYDNYQIKEITVITSDFERGYRLFKYMGVKDKLVLHHLDCKRPERCYHFKWYIGRNSSTLPSYASKVQGTKTEMVKIIK